jgi:hypothetical protein
MVVENIPQCFNGIRRLIIKHNSAMNKKIKTLNDQLNMADRTQNQRWTTFTMSLSKHFRGEITNASDKALVEYFREQETNVEKLNRICRKSWETLDYIKTKLLSQVQHEPSNELGWNKICQKLTAVNRSLIRCVDDMDEKFRSEIYMILDIMERVIIDKTR